MPRIRIRHNEEGGTKITYYERLGGCLRCGQCCYNHNTNPDFWAKALPSPLGEDTREATNRDHSATIVIEDRCHELGENNLCSIYDRRPSNCRDWPRGPTELLPGCGYFFMELDRDGEDAKLVAVHKPDPRGPV